MSNQYNLKYIPAEALKNKNVFLEEFYTSVDTDVYINDIKCDLVNSIAYSVQEQLHPIYGYNSYTYDDVSIGTRIVAGTIRIPISNYDDFIKDFTSLSKNTDTDENIQTADNVKPDWAAGGSSSNSSQVPYSMIIDEMFNNGEIITFSNIQNAYKENISTFVSDPSAGVVGGVNNDGNNLDNNTNVSNKPKYSRDLSPFFQDGYDEESLETNIYKTTYRHNYCNITLKIGNTVKKTLKDVIFRSLDNSIDAEGDPLFETLQFIARDLVEENLI